MPTSVAAIYRHGGGNPFYLEQLGRTPATELAAALAGNGVEGGVPAAVEGAIAGELESLSPTSRVLLDAAAVAGEPFEPDLAAAIAELSQAEGLDALDELLDRDLIRPTEVPRRFIFRHPLVRRAVYESARGGWRLAAHAGRPRRSRRAAPRAAERAHHVEQSAGQGDAEAIELLLEAGRAAASRAPAPRRAGSRPRCACCPPPTRSARWRCAWRWPRRSARSASWSAAANAARGDRAARSRGSRAQGRADGAVRGGRALAGAPRRGPPPADARVGRACRPRPPEAAALQIELRLDGMYRRDFEQAIAVGGAALDARAPRRRRSDRRGRRRHCALAEAASGKDVEARAAHRAEALEQIERLSDAELARRLETLYYLGWAENYLERYDDAIAHAARGVQIARATGEGRLLIPLMLVRGYPLEMQGRLTECIEMCENAVEGARLSANPHYLSWALFELGWGHYFSGHLEAAIEACEESARVAGGRLKGGTMPSAGGGPGWALAVAWQEIGETERAFELMESLGHDLGHVPVERCFNWENMALAQLTLGRPEAAEECVRQAEELSAGLDLQLPAGVAARTRAAVLLAAGDAPGAAAAAGESTAALDTIGAALAGGVLALAAGARAGRGGGAGAGDRGAARGRAGVRRVRVGTAAGRGAARAAQARRARRGAREGCR